MTDEVIVDIRIIAAILWGQIINASKDYGVRAGMDMILGSDWYNQFGEKCNWDRHKYGTQAIVDEVWNIWRAYANLKGYK